MKFVNQKFVWLILSLIVFTFQVNAQEKTFNESVLSENGIQAHQKLLKIKLFAIGGIGIGGETSEGEKVFDVLLEEKESGLAFESLIKNGTIESGMYGLFGLKIIGCDCFEQKFADFKKSRISKSNKETFDSQSGCSPFNAKTNSDKEFLINYLVSEGFDHWATWKKKLIEQRKQSRKQEKVETQN